MKYISIVITFFINVLICNSQSVDIVKQKTIGGGLNDNFTSISIGSKVIVGGTSLSGITGDKTVTNHGFVDFWVLQLDENFDIEWQVGFGGSSGDDLYAIESTDDGGFILAGSSKSPVSGNKTVNTNGSNDFWIIKINQDGTEEWQASYGGFGGEFLSDIEVLSDGSLLLLGSTSSSSNGDVTGVSYGEDDYWLLKVDENGVVLWDKVYGGSDSDFPESMVVDNNRIYIGGYSLSDQSGLKTEDNYGIANNWVLKLDMEGNLLWDKTIGGDHVDFLNDMLISNNSLYVLSSSSSGISGTKSEESRGDRDYWVSKLDTNGFLVDDVTLGGSEREDARSFILDDYGDIIILGDSESDISGDKTEPNNMNSQDFWLVSIDTVNLVPSWQKVLGGDQSEYSSQIHFNSINNSLSVFGRSNSGVSGDKDEPNQGGDDFWLLELSTDLSISTQEKEKKLSIYPNPTSSSFRISNLSAEENYNLTLFDNIGKIVLQSNVNSSNNNINVSVLSSGMYTIRLFDGKRRYISKLVVE